MSIQQDCAESTFEELNAELKIQTLQVKLESLRKTAGDVHDDLIDENLQLCDRLTQLQVQISDAGETIRKQQEQIAFHSVRHDLEQRIHDRLLAFYANGENKMQGSASISGIAALLDSPDLVPHAAIGEEIRKQARTSALRLAHTVSVIMPTYNRAVSIVRAIQSALGQSILPREIIVADDASTDGTLQLLSDTFSDEISSGQIVILKREKGGVCAMRNAALAAATGEVIAFLDSDNYWHKDHLLWALSTLAETDATSIYTGIHIHHLSENWSKVKCAPYDRKSLLSQNFIDLNCFVHKAGLNATRGNFDTSLTRLVDWDYVIRMTANIPPTRVPVATVEYFLDQSSLGNISFTQSLQENAFKIQFKHREEMIAIGALRGELKDKVLQFEAQKIEPAVPVNLPAPVREKQIPPVPDQAVPYMGDLPLFIVVPPGVENLREAPTWFVSPRYIHLHGNGKWSEVNADNATSAIEDQLPEGNYWVPDWRLPLPTAYQLATLVAATELTEIDLALGSWSLEALPSVAGPCLRNQIVMRENVVETFIYGRRFAPEIKGKVLRIQDSEQPHPRIRDLHALFAQDLRLDTKSQYFTFGATPEPAAARHSPNIGLVPPAPGKTRILTLAQKFAVGGVERNTIEISRQLRESHDCIYLTLEPISASQGSLCYQATESCMHVIDLAEIAHHGIYPELLRRLNMAYAPDALWICNGSMWLSENAPLIREIFSECGIVDQQVYDTEVGWIKRYQEPGVQSFDRFIAINGKIECRFKDDFGMDPDRIDLIFPSFNGKRFLDARARRINRDEGRAAFSLPVDKTLFAFMGRLVEQKCPLDFLEVARLSLGHEGQHFVMVGNGPMAERVDAFIAEHNLTNVTRIPNISDVTEFWPLVDAYLVTSQFEGLPIAFLEAISLGVPAIATDVGDIRFVVEKYGAGLVVDEIRNPHAFHEIVQTNQPNLAKWSRDLWPRGEEIIDFFSAETTAGLFAESFEKARQTRARVD